MTPPAALLLLGHLALATPTPQGAPPAPTGGDAVEKGWNARGALAAKRLAGPGLDACDRALEKAFQEARVKRDGARRMYLLRIQIDGESMIATWGYDGQRLEDFGVATMPPGWFLRLPAGSRTLTVLHSEQGCALDLCPGDPLSGAPCP